LDFEQVIKNVENGNLIVIILNLLNIKGINIMYILIYSDFILVLLSVIYPSDLTMLG